MRPARSAVLTVIAAALCLPGTAAASRHVGSVTVHRCGPARAVWCGELRRPLDPSNPAGPGVRIGFEWLPARERPALGTIAATEGGPGWPSTGSQREYRTIYAPLLDRRNLLLVDQRGTGRSDALQCPALQSYGGPYQGAAFAAVVGRCGEALDRGAVHASDLYSTAYAAEDLAAVIRALGVAPVDLYGDSYGTFLVQSFMARHPELLRSVVLDSAYPAQGLDPWYTSSAVAARSALETVCTRSAATCPPGTLARLAALVARLRSMGAAAPVGVPTLVDLVADAGFDPIIDRELDPSVRAALAGDAVPLQRLADQAIAVDNAAFARPRTYDDLLYFAVACTDYPQLFDMASPPAERPAQLTASLAGADTAAFAPFTAAEWLQMNAYSEAFDACLDWPAPVHSAPPVPPGSAPLPASVPVLVVGGDLDSWTPLPDARALAPTLGANVRVVQIDNAVHTPAMDDTVRPLTVTCSAGIIRAFVQDPGALQRLDASCGAAVPPIQVPAGYPLHVAGTTPQAVAAAAVNDARMRWWFGSRAGLRGGSFSAHGDAVVTLRLHRVRFVEDAAVTGTARWVRATGAVTGDLVVRGDDGSRSAVHVAFSDP